MGIIGQRLGPGGSIEYQEMVYKQIAARVGIAEEWLAGMHHPEMHEFLDMQTRQLIHELRAMVLSSEGGEEQPFSKSSTTTFRYTAPRRPWWISKKRWAKWKCDVIEIPRTLTVEGSVTPEYIYPDCSKVFPKEDRVVRIATMSTHWAMWKDS